MCQFVKNEKYLTKVTYFTKSGPIVIIIFQVKQKVVFLIYQESIVMMNDYNFIRNYGTQHREKYYNVVKRQLRFDKNAQLMKNTQSQFLSMKKVN